MRTSFRLEKVGTTSHYLQALSSPAPIFQRMMNSRSLLIIALSSNFIFPFD